LVLSSVVATLTLAAGCGSGAADPTGTAGAGGNGSGGSGNGGAAGTGAGGTTGAAGTGAAGSGAAGTGAAGTGAAGSSGAAGAAGSGAAGSGAAGSGVAGSGGSGASVPVTGLHADGNAIKNSAGQVVRLRGVNHSGTEYKCVQTGTGVVEGTVDATFVQTVKTWNVNVVRIPLNEDCWLSINGVAAAKAGDNYKNPIHDMVTLLEQNGIAPILELHWTAPGTTLATRQQPMPDMDHSVDFWTSVAMAYASDPNVVFEPFNEPFPASNADSDAAWMCWKNGCTANMLNSSGANAGTYTAVGMQALVDAIRGAGANNLILLGGVQYSNRLTQWTGYKPTDSMNNLAAAWHVYNFNGCKDMTCWGAAPATLATTTPILATEFGENDCMASFVNSFMSFMDSKAMGYLAWTWNTWGACTAGSATGSGGTPWALVSAYGSSTPNSPYAQAVHDHFVGP
jgi:hypothetical protein